MKVDIHVCRYLDKALFNLHDEQRDKSILGAVQFRVLPQTRKQGMFEGSINTTALRKDT